MFHLYYLTIIFILYDNYCPLPFKKPFKRLNLFILICNCCIKEFFIGDIGISGCQQHNSQWSSALNLGWIPHKSMRSMATTQYVENKLLYNWESYSRLQNHHRGTLINFWTFFQGLFSLLERVMHIFFQNNVWCIKNLTIAVHSYVLQLWESLRIKR